MTCVAYLRVSSKGQCPKNGQEPEDEKDGFRRQRQACQDFAQTHDHQIEHVYEEKGVSGTKGEEDRPAFQQMVADLLSNGCRMVLVESLDRLARAYRIQEQLIIFLASKGIGLISVNTGENVVDAIMGDPMRCALVQVQGVFAELDRKLLVARLRKKREFKRAAGFRVEGRKPYGSRPGEDATLEFIRLGAEHGQSATELAERLNAANRLSRYGKPWKPQTIQKIVKRLKGAGQ